MKPALLLSIALSAALCGPALAQDAPERPRAEAHLISPTQNTQRWYGVGDVVSRVQLCVDSNTGRFQLRLTPQIASHNASGARELEVAFVTTTGERAQQNWDGKSELAFNGRVAPAGCGVGGNVSLEFRIKQRSLIAAVAGDYINQMQFSVDPA